MNAINRDGNVAADAKRFKLPYPVLVGRNSDIVKNYKLKSLPQLVIIDLEGKVALFEKFVKADEIKALLDTLLK